MICSVMMSSVLAAAAAALMPTPLAHGGVQPYKFADGAPKAAALSPVLVRLRTMALRKPKRDLHGRTAARTSQRAARLARVAGRLLLAPSNASDLVDSIDARYSPRKRRIAVELVHAFADEGTVVRRGTFFSLVGACRRASELQAAETLLQRLHDVGLAANPNVYSALMADLCHDGRPDDAMALEESMRAAGARPLNETYTVLISSLLRSSRGKPHAVSLALRLVDAGASYDLPLYHAMLQAVFAGGAQGAVREVLDQLRAAGHSPTAWTLNVLLKGFVASGSLDAALEVFNAFRAAGGEPGLIAYNILMDAFAQRGQLLNCDSLAAQLRAQVGANSSTPPHDEPGRCPACHAHR